LSFAFAIYFAVQATYASVEIDWSSAASADNFELDDSDLPLIPAGMKPLPGDEGDHNVTGRIVDGARAWQGLFPFSVFMSQSDVALKTNMQLRFMPKLLLFIQYLLHLRSIQIKN